jgi:hypothetical protein
MTVFLLSMAYTVTAQSLALGQWDEKRRNRTTAQQSPNTCDSRDSTKFNTNIDLAKERHQAGKEKYAAIGNVRDANRLFRGGNVCMKETNQYLRSAYEDLRKIERELRLYDAGT